MANIGREFLGWSEPGLPAVAQALAVRHRSGRTLDLGRVIAVLPGQRAGRRLQELLALQAATEGWLLTPPIIVTEGQLPEKLYTAQRPFATEFVQDFAWARALRALPEVQRRQIVPLPPPDNEPLRWLELGRRVQELHSELAADRLTFATVRQRAAALPYFHDQARWEALSAAGQVYLQILDALHLWDKQTARLVAIDKSEIRTDCDVVLLGTVDLNDALRHMLDQIAERVTAFIFAPVSHAERFDAYGCVIPERWSDVAIELPDDSLELVTGPADQAEAVANWLAAVGPRYRMDEVVIGVADESAAPLLQQRLTQFGAATRWVAGVRVGESAPYRLLATAVRFADQRRYEDFAALVRHPDIEQWLEEIEAVPPGQALQVSAQLDDFYNELLPSHVDAPFGSAYPLLAAAAQQIDDWLAVAARPRLLCEWSAAFRTILATVYRARTCSLAIPSENALHGVLQQLVAAGSQLDDVPPALDATPYSAADAFHIALAPLAQETRPPPEDAAAIEMLGWLELPLDDAPALIVTSFNEGRVPQSAGADPYLPDQLRRELRMLHNGRRYARDAYALTALVHSRRDLRLVIPRRDAKDDPLQPSRLLFACADELLVHRARRFFGTRDEPTTSRRSLLTDCEPLAKSLFVVPPPRPLAGQQTHFSVTQIKDYLASPYRYYLRHVEKLRAVDDASRELDGGTFGTLLHKVLGEFGRAAPSIRHAPDTGTIRTFLEERLAAHSSTYLQTGRSRPTLRLQLEQARLRLGAFAAAQAERTRAGWQIVFAESDPSASLARLQTPFVVDDATVTLRGQIDRIDYHPEQQLICILDYKTGDHGLAPEQTHRAAGEWLDLQLPLYLHLWRCAWPEAPANCPVQLGYFNLPKAANETTVELAAWQEHDLAEADEVARTVIRHIRAHAYSTNRPPKYEDEFAAICLENVLGPPELSDEEDGA